MIDERDEPAWQEPLPLRWVTSFFSGWRFPLLALVVLVAFSIILLVVAVAPPGDSAFAQFASEFRAWCFGENAATMRMEWGYLATSIVSPLVLAGILLTVWREPLRACRAAGWRAVAPVVGSGLLLVAASSAGMVLAAGERDTGQVPFPAEDLRTSHAAPAFDLVDHEGRDVSLASLRGRVVLITAFYTRCSNTCPMLLAQERRALEQLGPEEIADLSVLAVTLDPAHDTPEVLAEVAKGRSLEAPLHRLVTGEPAAVERVLDALSIARERDPATGVIEHANMFFLVDRAGRIAYRFTLGDRQERWLVEGLRALLAERPVEPA